jgi:hypothetical protein
VGMWDVGVIAHGAALLSAPMFPWAARPECAIASRAVGDQIAAGSRSLQNDASLDRVDAERRCQIRQGASRCALGYGRYGMHIIASILLAAGSACIRMPEVERIAV